MITEQIEAPPDQAEAAMTLAEAAAYSEQVAAETGSYAVQTRGLRAAIKRGRLAATQVVVTGQPVPMWYVTPSALRAYMAARPQRERTGRPPGPRRPG